eukprot:s1680_g2.t1
MFAMALLRRLQKAGAEERIWPTQFAFRTKRGSADAIFVARRLLDLTLADRNGTLVMLSLDWEKAFDSISVACSHFGCSSRNFCGVAAAPTLILRTLRRARLMAATKRRRLPEVDKENLPGNVCPRNKHCHAGDQKVKTVEEIYQKKSQLEHILLRPDSYVGSIERQTQEHWVLDDASQRMSKRSLEYVPALYKIFDEILVNAADNLIRDPTQNIIRVEVKRKEGSLSVWNNGAGLPIQMHREHKCYVPELVFGHLLTSDNYDDSEKKVVGGRNGYGAKLTNIFSTKFMLETADSRSGKKYKQVWEKNMTVCHKPSIVQNKSEDYTQVTFFPDFARFGMRNLEEDIVALMRRRAFDLAASTQGRCQVFLDGQCLGVSSFQDYVDLHVKPEMFRTCKVVNDRWEIAIGLTDGSGFQQVSFVNSINTSRGGTHVTYIADQVVSAILDKIGKQKSGGTLAVKSQHVKSFLWIFVNCLIENPAFDSQTKETLTSKRERFGSACRLPEELLEDVVSSGIVEALQFVPAGHDGLMPATLSVGLLSGETVALEVSPTRVSVGDVRELAEDRLHRSLSVLVSSSGEPLKDSERVSELGLKHGDVVSALVRPPCPQIFSGPFAYAFAAVMPEGHVVAWGDPARGGDNRAVREQLQEVPIIALEASAGAFAALRKDGQVVTWGGAAFGGDSSTVQDRLVNVQAVKASAIGFSAVTAAGDVVTWGSSDTVVAMHIKVEVKQLVASTDAFAALAADGRAFAWGNADYGGSCSAVADRLVDITSLAASDGAFAAVKQDGEVVMWGNSNFGGDCAIQNPDLHSIVSITACGRAFAALRGDGCVFTWGDSTQGGDSSVLAASQVSLLRGSAGAFAALTMEGRVLTWGNHAFGGDCSAVSDQLTQVVDIVASRRAFAALRRDGGVVSWGFAVLGGNSKDVQAELYGIQSLHASSGAFAALRDDGGVIVWGGPSSGGDNSAIRGLFQETDVDDEVSEVDSPTIAIREEWSKAMGKNELAQHLNRSDLGLQKRLFGVPKLEDANLAGTKEGESCTLILTEGDSAKALAVAGLGVVGRDRYGVFPLRGKLRNVRELTVKQMLENKEIEQVLKIMALDASKDEYRDAKGLRYGSIMIMTDQDHDGSHIKGLIINFIQHWFPSLLRLPGFLKEFVTPIVKVGLN